MNIEKEPIIPELTVNRTLPFNFSIDDEACFSHELIKTLPAVHTWKIRGVNISDQGILFQKLSTLRQNLIYEKDISDFGTRYLLSQYIKNKKINLNKNETYILAFDYWSHGYFHWMCDTLPRLMAIKSLLTDAILLLPQNYTYPFVKESLAYFIFKEIFFIPSNTFAHAPNLIIPEHIASTGNFNPEIMCQIRELLTSGKNTRDANQRIYISRKKAKYRYVINEEEVIEIVKKYDFKIIYYEELTLNEQILLTSNAGIIIGIHGANLTNILFMKPNSFVLELRKENDNENNAYFSLASAMRVHYLYQFCKYSNSNYDHPTRFDLIVDTIKLEANINLILS